MGTQKNMLPRICRECGKSFLGGPRAWYCEDCRGERKKKQLKEFRERKRMGMVIPNGAIIKCEICGKEIIKNGGLQRFCDDCAAEHLKAVDNAQSLEWKKKNPEKIKESKRKLSRERYKNGEQLTSGIKGVSWDKSKMYWKACIGYGGKQYIIARTKNLDLAIKARKEAEQIKKSNDENCETQILKLKEKYKNEKNKIPDQSEISNG